MNERQGTLSSATDYMLFGNNHNKLFKSVDSLFRDRIDINNIDSKFITEKKYLDKDGNMLSLYDIVKILNDDDSINSDNNNYKNSFAHNEVTNGKESLGIPLDQILKDIIVAKSKGIDISLTYCIDRFITITKTLKEGDVLLNSFDVYCEQEPIILNSNGQVTIDNKIIDINSIFKNFANNLEKLSRKEVGQVCLALKIYELLKENNCHVTIDEVCIKNAYDYINKGFIYQNTLSNDSMLDFIYAFTKYFARINGLTVQIEFFSGTRNDMGYSDNGIIGLNKNISVVNPNTLYTDTLETIFHEVFHEIQRQEREVNRYTFGNTIDRILRNNNRSYYNSNYKKILYEVDARYNSCLILLNYLKDLIPEKYDDYHREYTEKIEQEIGNREKNIVGNYNMNKNKYTNDGSTLSRDSALEQIVKNNTEILNKYPILKYVFNSDGTRKTIYELIDVLNEHANDKNSCIIDMINYWIRTSSYSIDSIINEYLTVYDNGIEKLPNEIRKIIKKLLNQKLTETILFESSNTQKDIWSEIIKTINNYNRKNPQINIDDFLKVIKEQYDIINQNIQKAKGNLKKQSLRDKLLGISYDINDIQIMDEDGYMTDNEIAEIAAWNKILNDTLKSQNNTEYADGDISHRNHRR